MAEILFILAFEQQSLIYFSWLLNINMYEIQM
jgi:hypothetical protein